MSEKYLRSFTNPTWCQDLLDDVAYLKSQVKKQYILPKHVTDFYVRPDGNDENTGLANTAAEAWKTIDHATEFLNSHTFIGTGSIQINIADGSYTTDSLGFYANASFANPASEPYPADPINAQMVNRWRIRFVGNVDHPENVVYTASKSKTSYFNLGNSIGIYGLTLAKEQPEKQQAVGTLVTTNSNHAAIANCILSAKSNPEDIEIPSPYAVFRGSGRISMYGNLRIKSPTTWHPYVIWWPEYSAIYYFGHFDIHSSNTSGTAQNVYVSEKLNCIIESSVNNVQYAYFAADTTAGSIGIEQVAGCSITAQGDNPNIQYRLSSPSMFISQSNTSIFPGINTGQSVIPDNLYITNAANTLIARAPFNL